MYGGRRFFRPVGPDGNAGADERGSGAGREDGADREGEKDGRPEIPDFGRLIREEYLVNALAAGVSYELFWHLNPAKLKYFFLAQKKRRQAEDERDYLLGLYVREALRSTVCNAFLWKRKGAAPDQYPAKPFLRDLPAEQENRRMTEDEKQRAVDLFFAQEKVRRVNWQRAHGKAAKKTEPET